GDREVALAAEAHDGEPVVARRPRQLLPRQLLPRGRRHALTPSEKTCDSRPARRPSPRAIRGIERSSSARRIECGDERARRAHGVPANGDEAAMRSERDSFGPRPPGPQAAEPPAKGARANGSTPATNSGSPPRAEHSKHERGFVQIAAGAGSEGPGPRAL